MDTPDSAASVREGGLASDIIETVRKKHLRFSDANNFIPNNQHSSVADIFWRVWVSLQSRILQPGRPQWPCCGGLRGQRTWKPSQFCHRVCCQQLNAFKLQTCSNFYSSKACCESIWGDSSGKSQLVSSGWKTHEQRAFVYIFSIVC